MYAVRTSINFSGFFTFFFLIPPEQEPYNLPQHQPYNMRLNYEPDYCHLYFSKLTKSGRPHDPIHEMENIILIMNREVMLKIALKQGLEQFGKIGGSNK